jgi:hypothetical protein
VISLSEEKRKDSKSKVKTTSALIVHQQLAEASQT